jgi:uncharacterized protein YceH (UPF0502 family)
MTDESASPDSEETQRRWKPLPALERRVVGVLMEKGKTTPNTYPMSLNAVTTGCNQKSNRAPTMQLEPEDVEESLERLREMGAVGLIQGAGRVSKYRHYMYDWLDVDKVEIAVMAELILRGPQTVGELRGRASRMEPIAGIAELQPVLQSLKTKGLILALTPEGRGHVVTHALFSDRELERVKQQYANVAVAAAPPAVDSSSSPAAPARPPLETSPPPAAASPEVTEAMARQIEDLRLQVSQLKSDMDDLSVICRQTDDELQRLKGELGV